MIQPKDLVQYAQKAIGGGYAWGASGQTCSLAFRKELLTRAPDQTNLMDICGKWDGKPVWDCAGLIAAACRAAGGAMKSGATTQYQECCEQTGTIDRMPDLPGVAVFRTNNKTKNGKLCMQHVGLYIGNGMVIDARGSREGVVISALGSFPWTHWGLLSGVNYDGVELPKPTIGADALYLATVINVKTGLNFRSSPISATNTIMLLPLGAVVEVLEDNAGNGMCKARYLGKVGYCTRSYLTELVPEEVPDEPTEEPDPEVIPGGSNTFELKPLRFVAYPANGPVTVQTLDGQVIAGDGDYIVEELPGGPYVVTYEAFRALSFWVAPSGELREI